VQRAHIDIRLQGLAGAGAAVVVAIALGAGPALAAPAGAPSPLAGYWINTTPRTLKAGPVVKGTPTFRTSDGLLIPLLPEVAKMLAERRNGGEDIVAKPHFGADGGAAAPAYKLPCLTPGMPSVAAPWPPYPIEFVVKPEQVSVLLGFYRNYRIIRMNTDHPEDPDPAFMGDSIGRWDKGTLVVDTVAVRPETVILGAIPHSDQLHIVERIRPIGKNTLESRITIDDPKTFSKPWTTTSRFKKENISDIPDYACGLDK